MRKRKFICSLLLLCLILALSGCQNIKSLLASRNEEDNSGSTRQGYSVYYINEEETRLTPVSYRLESTRRRYRRGDAGASGRYPGAKRTQAHHHSPGQSAALRV